MAVKRKREEINAIEQIKGVQDAVLTDKSNVAELSKIMEFLKSDIESDKVAAIHSLYAIFEHFIEKNYLTVLESIAPDSLENVTAKLAFDIYQEFICAVCAILKDNSQKVCIASIKALCDLWKRQSVALSKNCQVCADEELLVTVLESFFELDSKNTAFQAFLNFYVNEYDDVKYYVLKNTTHIINNVLSKKYSKSFNVYTVLCLLETTESIPEDISNFFLSPPLKDSSETRVFQRRYHKRVFNDAWVTFLRLPLKPSMFKKILTVVNDVIIPNMSDPRQLHDFLTETYNHGGILSILALQGLFRLIHKYNLDYPSFYDKLYLLFDRNMAHSSDSQQFLKLANLFLRSTHLPSYLVAAFIKRMARLCLLASPALILSMLSIIYRLLREHPSCRFLIHNERKEELDVNLGNDPYIFEENDMKECNAMKSSLWELVALESHICPHVSSFIKKFKQEVSFTGLAVVSVNDVLVKNDFTYLEESLEKDITKAPALAEGLKGFKSLFAEDSFIL